MLLGAPILSTRVRALALAAAGSVQPKGDGCGARTEAPDHPPAFLTSFSRQRAPCQAGCVRFLTSAGPMGSPCASATFEAGARCWARGRTAVVTAGLIPHAERHRAGLARDGRGRGCGVARSAPSQQGIGVLHLPLQWERSYCTSEQLSGGSSDGRM